MSWFGKRKELDPDDPGSYSPQVSGWFAWPMAVITIGAFLILLALALNGYVT